MHAQRAAVARQRAAAAPPPPPPHRRAPCAPDRRVRTGPRVALIPRAAQQEREATSAPGESSAGAAAAAAEEAGEESEDRLRPDYDDLSDEQVRGERWAGAPRAAAWRTPHAARRTPHAARRPAAPRPRLPLAPPPSPAPTQIDDLVDAASGLISVLPELRPLDRAAFNAGYEVWRAIAAVPPRDRYRIIEELEPGAIRNLWKASMGRCGGGAARAGRAGRRGGAGRAASGRSSPTCLAAAGRRRRACGLPCVERPAPARKSP
jgi:hypothetical protein